MKEYLSSHRVAFLLYTALFASITSPFLFFDEIVSPYNQCVDFGHADSCRESGRIEHKGLTDHPSFFIPEIYLHLNGSRSGWMALWTSKNELGRPLSHIAGFSPAYLPSWLIAQLTNDPWRFLTIYSLLMCYMSGIFIILFCREYDLHPYAGLVAGSSLALSPTFMFWLIFPMYVSVWCWAAGILWGLARTVRCRDLLGWSGLTFSIYSIAMTGYPQYVIHHAYILSGYAVSLVYRICQSSDRAELWKTLGLITSSLFVGAASILPVFIDLAHTASESNQGLKTVSFFTMYLQGMGYWIDAIRFFIFITLPEYFGNFADDAYALPFYGFSITLVTLFCILMCLFTVFRRTWGWWLAISVFVILTFSYTLYEFGVKHLGFNLSPVLPIANSTVPLAILVAFGSDALVRSDHVPFRSRVVLIALIGVFIVNALAFTYGFLHGLRIHWSAVFGSFVILCMFAAQIGKPRPICIFIALVVATATVSYPVMLRQSASAIINTSPLIETMRTILVDGGRYIIANPGYGLSLLPPNLNARLNLETVHNSNSMASRRYQTWLESMNDPPNKWMGGRSSSLSPTYESAMFWMSNVSLVLSPTRLEHANLEFFNKQGDVHLYRVVSRMGNSLQIFPRHFDSTANEVGIEDPRLEPRHNPVSVIDQGDLLEFHVMTGPPSILLLSQKYHRDWKAKALGSSGWYPASTLVINGVFQGVAVPQDTQKIRLEFTPHVRLAWIAHLFWLLLLCLLIHKYRVTS